MKLGFIVKMPALLLCVKHKSPFASLLCLVFKASKHKYVFSFELLI